MEELEKKSNKKIEIQFSNQDLLFKFIEIANQLKNKDFTI